MLDRNGLTNEILALVDSNPQNEVSLKELIEKYSIGLSKQEQFTMRGQIMGVLDTLKKHNEIDYPHYHYSLNYMAQNEFPINDFIIKSTYNRVKENKAKETTTPPIISFGEFKGNYIGGNAEKVNQTMGEEDSETKQIHKEALKVHKDTKSYTLILILLTILIVLLTLKLVGWI